VLFQFQQSMPWNSGCFRSELQVRNQPFVAPTPQRPVTHPEPFRRLLERIATHVRRHTSVR
jgi:hypothetical protein